MEKLSIAEFAKVVGTSAKTIYNRINDGSDLPVNEKLKTVNEKIKGREVRLIITNSEQINLYKSIYGNLPVNEGEYYENVTVNDGNKPLNNVNEVVNTKNDNSFNNSVFDRLMTVNEDYNNRILQLTTELITAKQNQLLLEDKAGREGLYINEINELKKENNGKDKLIKVLITIIVINIIGILMLITYLLTVNYLNKPEEIKAPEPVVVQEVQPVVNETVKVQTRHKKSSR